MAYTTINKSSDYFNTKLYTGGSGNTAHTGVGFQPDLVWIKERTRVRNHAWFDAIRGARYWIGSNSSGAQDYNSGAYLVSLDSDGFTTTDTDVVGKNGLTYASWNWKAGGGQGSSNTTGSINTTYTSVNTTAGFSISTYTGNGSAGATIGHGLGVIPKMIIVKKLNGSPNWGVYHAGLGSASKYLELNTTQSDRTDNAVWDGATPTASVFYVGSDNKVNSSGDTYVAYCFAEKQGYSKFGSYTGNGNADGPMIFTGFKPNWVMIKETNGVGGWRIFDNKRPGYNEPYALLADNSDAETETGASRNKIDQLSNGFKLRFEYNDTNGAGGSYIYMAFGQSLVGSNNVPCTAR